MKSLEEVYYYHRLNSMEYSNEIFIGKEEELIEDYIRDIKLAYDRREGVGNYAKKFFDKESVSPSDIDKFKSRTQRKS